MAVFASVVGVDEEPGRPLLDTLADAVRYRQALLVLDNCEHLLSACASNLPAAARSGAPQLRVIATSREPLHVAAEIRVAGPAARAAARAVSGRDHSVAVDAVRLFAERAAAAAPGFSSDRRNAASIRPYAGLWTGCRWRSSLPPPGSGCCRSIRSPTGLPSGSRC